MRWIEARDAAGRRIVLEGDLEDGFFVARGMSAGGEEEPSDVPPTHAGAREACLETARRRGDDPPLELGRVAAVRRGEGVDVPIVFQDDRPRHGRIRRLVVFGDSLSDTGLLKRRLRVFPRPPYWMGRFSNGPVWVDYLEASTGLAIQNHAYGGAAITHHDPIPGEGLARRIKERGQFFVSGSVGHQVDDYLDGELLDGRLRSPDDTAFVLWAGANEYISKEPISSVITTFLNAPGREDGYERVADEAIAALEKQVGRLYDAGARRFVVVNLPDLGLTPIVLQNDTYLPSEPVDSEEGRRLELARRLSAMTAYHNRRLTDAAERLRDALPDADLVELDASALLASIAAGETIPGGYPAAAAGFELEPQRVDLAYDGRARRFHRPCYEGRYLGTSDPHLVCDNEAGALFWDVVHPSSYTHCWQAWFLERAFVDAGWLGGADDLDTHREWCRAVSGRTRGIVHTRWMFAAP